MKKICIVGGAGFIGHNLAIQLRSAGHEVTCCDSFSLRLAIVHSCSTACYNVVGKTIVRRAPSVRTGMACSSKRHLQLHWYQHDAKWRQVMRRQDGFTLPPRLYRCTPSRLYEGHRPFVHPH